MISVAVARSGISSGISARTLATAAIAAAREDCSAFFPYMPLKEFKEQHHPDVATTVAAKEDCTAFFPYMPLKEFKKKHYADVATTAAAKEDRLAFFPYMPLQAFKETLCSDAATTSAAKEERLAYFPYMPVQAFKEMRGLDVKQETEAPTRGKFMVRASAAAAEVARDDVVGCFPYMSLKDYLVAKDDVVGCFPYMSLKDYVSAATAEPILEHVTKVPEIQSDAKNKFGIDNIRLVVPDISRAGTSAAAAEVARDDVVGCFPYTSLKHYLVAKDDVVGCFPYMPLRDYVIAPTTAPAEPILEHVTMVPEIQSDAKNMFVIDISRAGSSISASL